MRDLDEYNLKWLSCLMFGRWEKSGFMVWFLLVGKDVIYFFVIFMFCCLENNGIYIV